MANLTIVEAAKHSSDKRKRGIVKLITERSPILEFLPMETIRGAAYTYNVENALPGVAFRGINETYSRSQHVINPVTERLTIIGGEVFIDNFLLNTQGNEIDLKAAAWAAKARAVGLVFSEIFFEGDAATNPRYFDGLKTRLTGSQVISGGTAALTLAKMDQLGDAVIGDSGKHIFLNKTLRRKITALSRDTSTGVALLDVGTRNLGKQAFLFNGMPLHIVERDDTEATILDFDETSSTASLYCVKFGDNMVKGISGAGGSIETYDLGESQTDPGVIGRLEWYVGLCVMHPRAAARLNLITNA